MLSLEAAVIGFHGGLFEFLRNDKLDAANSFSPIASGRRQKQKLRFNDFGWSFGGPIKGGPIKKDKLFFFAGEEWKKIAQDLAPYRNVLPTRAMLRGDFHEVTSTALKLPPKSP